MNQNRSNQNQQQASGSTASQGHTVNNMPCVAFDPMRAAGMFMMVPANWGQQPQAPPPGIWKGSSEQTLDGRVADSGKGSGKGMFSGMQVMGMMPNMDANAMAAWTGGMMPQLNVGMMPDGVYPGGMGQGKGETFRMQ